MYQMWVLFMLSLIIGTRAALRPLDFDDADYYLSIGPQATPAALLENIKRGHEGLLVKIQELNRALKEDEVKMNNVFYQLGQHNNDLKSMSRSIRKITDLSRSADAKISRQAFSVDFLKRNMEKLTNDIAQSKKKEVEVEALQLTVNRLEERLTYALIRLNLLDKKSAGDKDNINDIFYSARAPTFVTRPVSEEGVCPVGWNTAGKGCYWVSGEEANYATAVAACIKLGSQLCGLPPKVDLSELRRYMIKDKQYWTSATNAYSPSNQWSYLMTGTSLQKSSWEDYSDPWNFRTLHCAVIGKIGLVPARCSRKYKYICQSI